ncbi:MAG: hypothetical protein Ct9H300mP18_13600 [Candidatus Neomarinimicrobiota bacterium]|nr:MAG: hypothetical protein Ct9H300mP18_13600 [Candidatus Neomarinimicrobiota bacterium]
MMHSTDTGKPIILSNPQEPVSNLFRDIAKKIQSQLTD